MIQARYEKTGFLYCEILMIVLHKKPDIKMNISFNFLLLYQFNTDFKFARDL